MPAGDDGLREAITRFTEWVYNVSVIGPGVTAQKWEAPLFTYLLSPKQFNVLKAICEDEGWPPPENRGITFYPHVIKHILTARKDKDELTWQECATILTASLKPQSTVVIQKSYDQQVVVLNSQEVLRIGKTQEKYRGMLILEVSINDLAPVTAYHASEAKSRAIMRNSK